MALIMRTSAFYLLPLVGLLLGTTTGQSPSPSPLTDAILLNCGGPSNDKSGDGRTWYGDEQSKFRSSNFQMSLATKATEQDSGVTRVPYMTARISTSNFTYTFPVLPGPKFIRLYFYPATYSPLNASTNFNTSNSFFTVTANNYILLSNFSAYLTVFSSSPQQRDARIIKEFIVTVWDKQSLILSFSPSPSSFVFINGIEIVSIPNDMYTKDTDEPYKFVNSETFFYFDNFTALETVYRLNVGGGEVLNIHDTGMFRAWLDDINYIVGGSGIVHSSLDVRIKYTPATPKYTAPEVVYNTIRTMGSDPKVNIQYNLTWLFSVDSGFNYLVRLHFCETEKFVSGPYERVFSIFINNMTAEKEADVFHWTGGNDIPVYKDYIVLAAGGGQNKQKLWLALHPNSQYYADAILNGLEIFKLNKSNGDLSAPNPELFAGPATPEQHPVLRRTTKRKGSSPVAAIIGAVLGVMLVFSLVIFFFVFRKKRKEEYDGNTEHKSLFQLSYTCSTAVPAAILLPTDLCRKFTMAEIAAATRNFNDENVIGNGGFGTVYKGFVENGSVPVAIKRLDSWSKQGIREFHTEIEMLSRLRHAHLVSLIGYCDDQGEMILVYEFMPHGNLQDHLYKRKKIPLPWKQRLQICIGAARGLHYLHTGAKDTIIHRDVKSSNILLDSNWVAKVSDFGLSKTGPTSESQTHVSTIVKGSFGYLDPEYLRRQKLTDKSDVYSFGVVLLEVVCGRSAMMTNEPKERVSLVEWARYCRRRGTIDEIIDPELNGDMASVSFNKFMEIAESCVGDKAIDRPAMGDVVWRLEFALQLQQNADQENVNDGDDSSKSQKDSSVPYREVTTTDDDNPFTSSSATMLHSISTVSGRYSNDNSDRVRSENVFSEIMNQHGR